MSGHFHPVPFQGLRDGSVVDVQHIWAREVLEAQGANPKVTAEIRMGDLPSRWPWAVLAGLEEAVALLEGRKLDVDGLPEGSVVYPQEPVLSLEGPFLELVDLETALLGVLSQPTAVATAAARCRLVAKGRPVYSMGARWIHPAIAPIIERAAYVGGCDGVGTRLGGDHTGTEPVGSMASSLALILGEPRAWQRFDEVVDRHIPRVAVVGSVLDEKQAALSAVEALGERLAGVRLDVPHSRRGDLGRIAAEVRWELDARGYSQVRILLSGDIDESIIPALNAHADAYGVGRAVSAAAPVGFSLDLVRVDGAPRSARGVLSGAKHLWRCDGCGSRGIAPAQARLQACPSCGARLRDALVPMLRRGTMEDPLPPARHLRERALREVESAIDPFA
ncbi:MAG: nicotinate phosphoribosyltransferase [Actinomycetota bacterium]|nr:nicotinate phosphoribosyltransferase [Actinomycetota bacterium]